MTINKKVFIAVPCYDGKIHTESVLSIMNNMEVLRRNDINSHIHFETGDCYIAIARSKCVAKFLESDCTDMVFVDSDIGFDCDAILKLLSPSKDIVCGLYPFKQDVENYPVRLVLNKNGTYKIDRHAGLIEIEGGPTGLMKISRNAIEEMIKAYPQSLTNFKTPKGSSIYALFDTGILKDTKDWYGEDYMFCLRWRDIGGKVWAEPNINFDHIGTKMYSGNYKKYMDTLPTKESV